MHECPGNLAETRIVPIPVTRPCKTLAKGDGQMGESFEHLKPISTGSGVPWVLSSGRDGSNTTVLVAVPPLGASLSVSPNCL